jgi:hypothetical protein
MGRNQKFVIALALVVVGGAALVESLRTHHVPDTENQSLAGTYEINSLPGALDAETARYWEAAFRNGDTPGWHGLELRGKVLPISNPQAIATCPACPNNTLHIRASGPIGGVVEVVIEAGPQIGERFYVGEGVFRCFVNQEGCEVFPFMNWQKGPRSEKEYDEMHPEQLIKK